MAQNMASALCYLFIPAIIFLLIEPYNRDRTVRFHAWQAIALAIGLFAVRIVLGIVLGILFAVSTSLGLMVGMLWTLLGLAEFVLFVFLAVKAYNNQRIVLPIIGPFAEKQA
jgi:uncharacterized membrane protein